MTETTVEKITVVCAIAMYKRYRYDRSLLLTEKRYVMEAFWRYSGIERENAMRYQDWLFDYCFSSFEVKITINKKTK